MRKQETPYPKNGDERIITKFLFLPKRIGNETRCGETARILQRYKVWSTEGDASWEDVAWVGEEKR